MVILLVTADAAAYVDPGVGNLMYQLIIAAIVVLLLTGKRWLFPVLRQLKKFFNGPRSPLT